MSIKSGANIAIYCLENKNVVTEKNYFGKIPCTTGRINFSTDKLIKEKLNINNIIWIAEDLEHKTVEKNIKKISISSPAICAIYMLCDRDHHKDAKIENVIKKIEAEVKKHNKLKFTEVIYLKYNHVGEKFENFLSWHDPKFNVSELEKNKNDGRIYEKVMGRKLNNFDDLVKRLKRENNNFQKLFSKHEIKID